MKAIDLLKVNGELFHKSRTETDLIRHIETREGEMSNYNLLLGAGCSVTSGIRTAQKLINEWTVELYERYKDEETDIDTARVYLEKEQASWYSPSSPYSSLFEKKFDLPSQRRRFVEQEVDKKLPSIGYSYLVSMVKYNYFSNIFTTNFDDLINEAFYQFSSVRPIHCAHDSSIHSISVTSKRPKIVKLHGDYLFDDIKSTLKETESLEQNTKEKLVEFCKEYGLIVVGYSGSDRSIMDTLEFLVKQDNYLKNGIYWCLRKNDDVSHALRNLLWKDKVYPVLIDGFDEFFANCHRSIVGESLDLRPNNKESKLQKTIKSIIDDGYSLSKNTFIQEDIKNLKEESSKQDISEFLGGIDKDEDSFSGVGITDLRNLLEVDSVKEKNGVQAAYELCESYFNSLANENVKSKYISKLVALSNLNKDSVAALRWAEQLISIDKNNVSYHFLKADCLKDLKDRKEYLEKQADNFEYSYELCNRTAEVSYELLENSSALKSNSEFLLKEVLFWVDKSLKLEPSLSNDAWSLKVDALIKAKDLGSSVDLGFDGGDVGDEVKNVYAHLEEVNKMHVRSLDLKTNKIIKSFSEEAAVDHLNFLDKAYSQSSDSKRRRIDFLKNRILSMFFEKDVNDILKDKVDDFYAREFDKKTNAHILLCKAEYLYGVLNDQEGARDCVESALDNKNSYLYLERALGLVEGFLPNLFYKVEDIASASFGVLEDSLYYNIVSEICVYKGDYEAAIDALDKAYDSGLGFGKYLSSKSFCLLKAGDYERGVRLFKKYRDAVPKSENEAFFLNGYFSAKKTNDSIYRDVDVRNIYNKTKDKGVEICGRCMLGETSKAQQLINKEISRNKMNYHRFKRWPILEGVSFEK